MLQVQPARPEHPAMLAPKLRAADLQEIKASTTEEPVVVLQRGLLTSDPALAIMDEPGNLLGLFGVVPLRGQENSGIIWMLGSGDLEAHATSFVRLSRAWIARLHERYVVLGNYIDARNQVHIRWLQWCGFSLLRLVPAFGVEKRPFYEFRKVRAASRLGQAAV